MIQRRLTSVNAQIREESPDTPSTEDLPSSELKHKELPDFMSAIPENRTSFNVTPLPAAEVLPSTSNWTCCSKQFDPRCLTYVVQVLVCLMVLIFCFIQLAGSHEDDGLKNFWLSTVGLIVGNFMPTLSQVPEYNKSR